MLETGPHFEGSFQLQYSDDRGRPVVCKETTENSTPPLPRGTAKHTHTAQAQCSAARAPHSTLTVPKCACYHFFPSPGGCRVPVHRACGKWLWLCSSCLSDLSDLVSVSISSSTLLVLVSLPLVRSWACPVQSCPVHLAVGSSCQPVVSSLLVWSFPLQTTSPSLPHLLLLSPQKQGPEGVCSSLQRRTQHNSSCRLGISLPSSHIVFTSPLLASIRRAATFPESTLVGP